MTARQLHHAAAPWGQGASSLIETLAYQIKGLQWQDDALCREMDPELFFTEQEVSVSLEEAKRACRMCPVRAKCLEWVLTEFSSEDDQHGVFGGVGASGRRKMRRELHLEVAA